MEEWDEREKRMWKNAKDARLEGEGEEDGMMDGIVGMINNRLIKYEFRHFDRLVFGEKDIERSKHSLKKLCVFLG